MRWPAKKGNNCIMGSYKSENEAGSKDLSFKIIITPQSSLLTELWWIQFSCPNFATSTISPFLPHKRLDYRYVNLRCTFARLYFYLYMLFIDLNCNIKETHPQSIELHLFFEKSEIKHHPSLYIYVWGGECRGVFFLIEDTILLN